MTERTNSVNKRLSVNEAFNKEIERNKAKLHLYKRKNTKSSYRALSRERADRVLTIPQ